MGQLDGRVALITGGGRGQGRAHALALAAAGAAVVVTDGPAAMSSVPYGLAGTDELAATVELVVAAGGQAIGVQADVRSRDQIEAAVDRAIAEFGSLDILAANAGICTAAPVIEMTDEMWAETLATNLTGVFHSIRAVLPAMLDRGWGRIVATSSMAGRGGSPNLAHYSASKFGVIGLVKSVALEVAGRGITVNALCPSTVNTAMVHHEANYRLFCPDLANPTREQAVARFGRLNPLQQPWMEPEAIARELVHLVTDDGYTTGAVVELGMGISAKKS